MQSNAGLSIRSYNGLTNGSSLGQANPISAVEHAHYQAEVTQAVDWDVKSKCLVIESRVAKQRKAANKRVKLKEKKKKKGGVITVLRQCLACNILVSRTK